MGSKSIQLDDGVLADLVELKPAGFPTVNMYMAQLVREGLERAKHAEPTSTPPEQLVHEGLQRMHAQLVDLTQKLEAAQKTTAERDSFLMENVGLHELISSLKVERDDSRAEAELQMTQRQQLYEKAMNLERELASAKNEYTRETAETLQRFDRTKEALIEGNRQLNEDLAAAEQLLGPDNQKLMEAETAIAQLKERLLQQDTELKTLHEAAAKAPTPVVATPVPAPLTKRVIRDFNEMRHLLERCLIVPPGMLQTIKDYATQRGQNWRMTATHLLADGAESRHISLPGGWMADVVTSLPRDIPAELLIKG